ncbi:type II secretion system F family protein [Dongshaea marina]|uniref:type II secretion system F family protein n=1 Tax=Dongshaea marina TaxID=2047966 RepID=UPI000D3E3D3F|nr:type II secretion system F family protein [Dongshaea marina]
MIYYLMGLFIVIFIFVEYKTRSRKKAKLGFLPATSGVASDEASGGTSLISFGKSGLLIKAKAEIESAIHELGDKFRVKILLFYAIVIVIGLGISKYLVNNIILSVGVSIIVSTIMGMKVLKGRYKKKFISEFPDAINLLASSISSGESLTNSLRYVAETIKGVVGIELKWVADRLIIGEPPVEVLDKASQKIDIAEYKFFISTLKVNIEQGGQLNEVIKKIDRIIFANYAADKKKMALTAEARSSAKIVASLPFIFLIIMRFLSPDNFDYIFTSTIGRYLLGYVVISELIGMGIIRMLLSGVK